MKKSLLFFALVAFITIGANAQTKVGFKGGVVMNNLKAASGEYAYDLDSKTGFEAGFVLQSNLGYGFAIQPELLFSQKASSVSASIASLTYSMSNIEVPINFQWGYQFDQAINMRPFVQFGPYFSYAVNRKLTAGVLGYETDIDLTDVDTDALKKFDYGLSAGIGMDIWKFQFMVRYNWGMGKVFDANLQKISSKLPDFEMGEANFNGLTISLGFLF